MWRTSRQRATLHWPWGQPERTSESDEFLYRVEAERYSVVIDAEREQYGVTDPVLNAYWYRVRHRTKCGVRLESGRFVRTDGTSARTFAQTTLQEALKVFKSRRLCQQGILYRQLKQCDYELGLVEAVEASMEVSDAVS